MMLTWGREGGETQTTSRCEWFLCGEPSTLIVGHIEVQCLFRPGNKTTTTIEDGHLGGEYTSQQDRPSFCVTFGHDYLVHRGEETCYPCE